MSVGVALQAVVTGLAQGAVYGLVALGFTLCYRLVRVLNLAHGDLLAGATFVAVLATVGTTPVLRSPSVGVAVAQVAVALVAGALLGALLYAVAVRPFGGELGWVAATLTAGPFALMHVPGTFQNTPAEQAVVTLVAVAMLAPFLRYLLGVVFVDTPPVHPMPAT